MDRTVIDPLEQMRDFDFVMFEHDVLVGLGNAMADILSGLPVTVVGGFTATQTSTPSLSINLTAGRIYQFGPADSTSDGSIPADATIIVQQGQNIGQTLTFTAPSAGQSQWNLIQAQFSQVDAVRTNDPNGGIVPFYNAANPAQPTTQSVNTVRQGLCVLQVITGAAATTGSQVPPNPSTGWVPLYLIGLAGGQTQITNSQILVAGPGVGTGVPTTYPYAPFLAGFLASHHKGIPGHAPKVNLATEVQGILPYVNMAPVRTLLNGVLNLYVNASTGLDTNNGLTPSTAFKTPQIAVNAVYRNYDFNGFYPVINFASGTYTTGVTLLGNPVGMGATNSVSLLGNNTTPASVIISVTSGCAVTVLGGGNVSVSGMTLLATGTSTSVTTLGCALYATQGSQILGNVLVFGACGTYHIFAQAGGQVLMGVAAYVISGSAQAHLAADAFGLVSNELLTVSLTGTPAFSVAFAFSGRCSVVQSIGTTFIGPATGPRYLVNQNGVITTGSTGNASYYPGSTVGSAATGGQYS